MRCQYFLPYAEAILLRTLDQDLELKSRTIFLYCFVALFVAQEIDDKLVICTSLISGVSQFVKNDFLVQSNSEKGREAWTIY